MNQSIPIGDDYMIMMHFAAGKAHKNYNYD